MVVTVNVLVVLHNRVGRIGMAIGMMLLGKVTF